MALIYLDARTITESPSGVGRYARCLIPELVARAPEHDFVIIRHNSNSEPLLPENEAVEEPSLPIHCDDVVNFAAGSFFLNFLFNRYGVPDLYHSLFHVLPIGLDGISPERGLKKVVTLHDLVWIDHPDASQESWWSARSIELFGRIAIPYALRNGDQIISVSSPTAERAEQWVGPDKLSTVWHGVERSFFESKEVPEAFFEAQCSVPRYLIAVGNQKNYKNLHRLLESFSRVTESISELELVLVGDCRGLKSLAEQLGVEQKVSFPGYVDDATLQRLVAHAELFVFPSLVEGFGLPILEAMALGTPVATSQLEPMASVAGEAAAFFDPFEVEEMAGTIYDILIDEGRREALVETGKQRAETFTWAKSAKKTLGVYRELL